MKWQLLGYWAVRRSSSFLTKYQLILPSAISVKHLLRFLTYFLIEPALPNPKPAQYKEMSEEPRQALSSQNLPYPALTCPNLPYRTRNLPYRTQNLPYIRK